MAAITIRQFDERLKTQLQIQAARHGRSMEEEALEILKAGVVKETAKAPNLAESIRQLIEPLGGVELTLPSREPVRRPPNLAK